MPLSIPLWAQVTAGVARAAWFAVRVYQDTRWKSIEIEAHPFADSEMLLALDVRVTNKYDQSLHLEKVWVASPPGAEFGFRWHIPIFFVGGEPEPEKPWGLGHEVSLNHTLAPGQITPFELGVPAGAAVHESRVKPVVFAVSFSTRGAKEVRGVRYLVRRLPRR